jgi:hypothetical protein
MHIAKSPSIRVDSRVVLATAALAGVIPTAFAQPTENLIIGFAQSGQVAPLALPLSAGLTVAIALILTVTAFVILRRRASRGSRLFGWLLALSAGATLAVVGGEHAISEAQAVIAAPAINLSVSPGTLELSAYWNADVDPLTVTVTNTTGQSVQITSVSIDDTDFYDLSTPTTCVVGAVLAPNAQCTVTMSIE